MTTTTPALDNTTITHSSSRGRILFTSAVGVVVGAGLTAGLVLGFGGAPGPTPAITGTVVTVPGQPGPAGHATLPTGGSAHHSRPVTPPQPPAPSAAVQTLQRELGQLNYYEGPITGTMNPQTAVAITYLQRDAHLPQTGVLTSATESALMNFLANGNNQMGS